MRAMANKGQVEILDGPAQLARRAAGIFIFAAKRAINERGTFNVALAGGSTPKAAYELLATDEYNGRVAWENIRFYFGDERDVPPDDDRSNFRMANDALLRPLGIDPSQIFRWQTELGDSETTARDYEMKLRGSGGFDLVLLGLGKDGHTASLFPGSEALHEGDRWAVSTSIPATGENRFTITLPAINSARLVVFLVSGERKSEIVEQIFADDGPNELPAAMVDPGQNRLIWLLDAAAASRLSVPADLHLPPHAP